jgi:demethylmenaquinone methyltransferase/2-methoxy-6-polyprenyl-1,4-benzoquinol methylase
MFNGMAARYGFFTRLIGFGQDQRLRREALKSLQPGMRVLDVGCGTGDLVLEVAQCVGPTGLAVGLDLSSEMLRVAQARVERLQQGHPGRALIRFVPQPAEALPLPEPAFDAVVSAYVLRNLYANIDSILVGIRGSLKAGGMLSFLDLTEPTEPFLRLLFRLYFRYIVGLYGLILFGRKYPVPYLPDSAQRFYKAHEFVEALQRAGFIQISVRRFMLGAVVLYQARVPQQATLQV